MIAFKVKTRSEVERFHQTALHNGATDEGAPGPRPTGGSIFQAYARDADGSKRCTYCAEGPF